MVQPWVILIIAVIIIVAAGLFSGLIATEFVNKIRNDIGTVLTELENKVESTLAFATQPYTVIDYGTNVPSNIPSEDFDLETAQFGARLVMSLVNQTSGADPIYPPQFEVVTTIGESQAVLLRRPLNSTSSTFSSTEAANNGSFFYVLCFRGSLTMQDVAADLSDIQTQYYDLDGVAMPGGMVQNGAYNTWILLKDQLLEVQNMIGPNDTLLFTADSLGCLLTTFTAYSYSKHIDPSRMSFYCLESIGIGNDTFLSTVEDTVPNHWYMRNILDVIPNYPNPVTISSSKVSLYSYPRKVLQMAISTSAISMNHYTATNLCGLDPSHPVVECPGDIVYYQEPQIVAPAPYLPS